MDKLIDTSTGVGMEQIARTALSEKLHYRHWVEAKHQNSKQHHIRIFL
jgi:hypothetical protein